MILTLGTSSRIHRSDPPLSGQLLLPRKSQILLRSLPISIGTLSPVKQDTKNDVASLDGDMRNLSLVSRLTPMFKPQFGLSPETPELPKPPDSNSNQALVNTNLIQPQVPIGGALVLSDMSLNPRLVRMKPFMHSSSPAKYFYRVMTTESFSWPCPWTIIGFMALHSQLPEPPDPPDPPSKSVVMQRLSAASSSCKLQNWSQFLVIDRNQFYLLKKNVFTVIINSVRCLALVKILRSRISIQKLIVISVGMWILRKECKTRMFGPLVFRSENCVAMSTVQESKSRILGSMVFQSTNRVALTPIQECKSKTCGLMVFQSIGRVALSSALEEEKIRTSSVISESLQARFSPLGSRDFKLHGLPHETSSLFKRVEFSCISFILASNVFVTETY